MSQPRLASAFALAFAMSLSPAAAMAATPEEEARAAELFAESADHYRDGRFEDAVRLLQRAYAADEPVLLYNLARAYEGNGDLREAIDAYRKYLERTEEVKDRGAIERRIATLDAQLAEREELAADAEAARRRAEEAEAQREQPSASPYPWIVAGAGGATLVVSAVLGGLAKSRQGKAEDEPEQIAAAEALDEAETFATATNVTLAVGGALLVGGLAWGTVDLLLLDSSDATALRLGVSPQRVALELTFQ